MVAPENNDMNLYVPPIGTGNDNSYPVHVYFFELSKMYMHRIRWNWHPELELILIEQGEAKLFTDDKSIHLNTGQMVLINQDAIHSLQSTDPDCSLYLITFHPSFLFGCRPTDISGKYLSPVVDAISLKTMLFDEQNPASKKLTDIVHSIISTNMSKKYGYELATQSLLCQFWLLLLEQITQQGKTLPRPNVLSLDENRVKEAILYIESHYSEQITLEQLASAIHVSRSECCRCFKRTLQLTPIEYLMRYRILKAATIIQNDDLTYQSISDLAFSVGFNNVSYFNKVFKQYIKCTPSKYKKNIKSMPADAIFPALTL